MPPYHLADDFTDPAAEQALLARLAALPARDEAWYPTLRSDLFPTERVVWPAVIRALAAGQPAVVPPDWTPAPDPAATVQRLLDLHQRRLLAAMHERLAQALFDPTVPAASIVTRLATELLQLQRALPEAPNGQLQWASALVAPVLAQNERSCHQRPSGWGSFFFKRF